MRISDWSSDVCSSDLYKAIFLFAPGADQVVSPVTYIYLGMAATFACVMNAPITAIFLIADITQSYELFVPLMLVCATSYFLKYTAENPRSKRSEEHTSELQSLMRISYAVFCLKKKTT